MAIHGLLALLLCRVPYRGGDGGDVLDTRVPSPGREIDINLKLLETTARPSEGGKVIPVSPVVDSLPSAALEPARAATFTPNFAQTTSENRLSIPPFRRVGEGGAAGRGTGDPPVSPLGKGGNGGVGTAFFDVSSTGRSVVYVLDRSLSMGPSGALEVVRRELEASLGQLSAECRFQIIGYNRRAEMLCIAGQTGLLPASAAFKREALNWLASLAAEGGTDHLPALRRALALEPDVIYFLTDADDLRGEHVQAVTLLNRGRATIHTIELTTVNRHRGDMPLHRLARDNRGRYQAVALP